MVVVVVGGGGGGGWLSQGRLLLRIDKGQTLGAQAIIPTRQRERERERAVIDKST